MSDLDCPIDLSYPLVTVEEFCLWFNSLKYNELSYEVRTLIKRLIFETAELLPKCPPKRKVNKTILAILYRVGFFIKEALDGNLLVYEEIEDPVNPPARIHSWILKGNDFFSNGKDIISYTLADESVAYHNSVNVISENDIINDMYRNNNYGRMYLELRRILLFTFTAV